MLSTGAGVRSLGRSRLDRVLPVVRRDAHRRAHPPLHLAHDRVEMPVQRSQERRPVPLRGGSTVRVALLTAVEQVLLDCEPQVRDLVRPARGDRLYSIMMFGFIFCIFTKHMYKFSCMFRLKKCA